MWSEGGHTGEERLVHLNAITSPRLSVTSFSGAGLLSALVKPGWFSSCQRAVLSAETYARMLATIPDARGLELEAGHNVALDRPRELAEAVIAFAREVA